MPTLFRIAALALCLAVPLAAAADDRNPLLAERWKTRPVVVVVPTPDDALLRKVEGALAQTSIREAFLDRDMVLYTVVAGQGRRNGQAIDAAQTRALLAGLKRDAAGPPVFLLVGKDGGIKMTEGPEVDLQAVFAEIDRMPMRRR